jgi:hypothetical protein
MLDIKPVSESDIDYILNQCSNDVSRDDVIEALTKSENNVSDAIALLWDIPKPELTLKPKHFLDDVREAADEHDAMIEQTMKNRSQAQAQAQTQH